MIDIQVNGYAGIDFNAESLSRDQIQHVAQTLQSHAVHAIFPTLISDEVPLMAKRLADLRAHIDSDPAWRRLMPAFHLEGPCLSPRDGFRGAHPAQYILDASPEIFKHLIDAAGGPDRIAIITLAPEHDPGLKTTRWLANQGIRVSAGHTDASRDLLLAARAEGLSMYTHLGNGCPPLLERHDNIINRVLSINLHTSFIPDGHHVPFWVLANWFRQIDPSRLILTTDAMAAAGAPPGRYRLGPWHLDVGEDRIVRPPGKNHLAGSALTMPEARANAISKLGMSESAAHHAMHVIVASLFPHLFAETSPGPKD